LVFVGHWIYLFIINSAIIYAGRKRRVGKEEKFMTFSCAPGPTLQKLIISTIATFCFFDAALPYFCAQIFAMSNRTFTMIKPDAMKNGHAGAILDKIIKAGFRVVALKQTKLSIEKAGEFYAVHKERPFYGELTQFMSSGVIIAAILEKDNAVADFRTLIGATDPAKADEGTIRKLFATSLGENAVHGSDSDENAKIEGDFFFSGLEQY
jgi:nucleoside-diphosphate kinase